MRELEVCIISVGTSIQGKIEFTDTVRFHGRAKGEILGAPGSSLTLSEESLIEGEVSGDHVVIEGFVQGSVRAERLVIRGTARIRGKVASPQLLIEPGAVLEAEVQRVTSADSPSARGPF